MLNMPIENEIETEHKVWMNFNMRQVIAIIIGALVAVGMYLYFRDWVLMVIFTLPFAAVLGFFTWKDENGRPAEEILLKKVQETIYKNTTRKYRTKNGYMPLLNAFYGKMKRRDSNNKLAVKEIKRAEKQKKKRMKTSKVRGIK